MDGPRSLWHKSGRYRKLAVKRRSGGESLGRETPKPRMCVGRNRDQPWSYRYCRITLCRRGGKKCSRDASHKAVSGPIVMLAEV